MDNLIWNITSPRIGIQTSLKPRIVTSSHCLAPVKIWCKNIFGARRNLIFEHNCFFYKKNNFKE